MSVNYLAKLCEDRDLLGFREINPNYIVDPEAKDLYFQINSFVGASGELPGPDWNVIKPHTEYLKFDLEHYKQEYLVNCKNFLVDRLFKIIQTKSFSHEDIYASIQAHSKEIESLTSALKVETPDKWRSDFLNAISTAHLTSNEEFIPTGFSIIDDVCGGYRAGSLDFWAARPYAGKTFFLLASAFHAASLGKNVLFTSCEMSSKQLYFRLMGLLTNHNYDLDLRLKRKINPPEFTKELIYITDHITFSRIPAGTRAGKVSQLIRHGDYDITFIDSAYLLRPSTDYNRSEKWVSVQSTMEELKGHATELNIPIVASTQFNRSIGNDSDLDDMEKGAAGTDAITQLAGILIAIQKYKENPKMRKLTPVKLRDSEELDPFYVNFSPFTTEHLTVANIEPPTVPEVSKKGIGKKREVKLVTNVMAGDNGIGI